MHKQNMKPKIAGRFIFDDLTSMLHDTENEVDDFAVERLDEIARILFDKALSKLCVTVTMTRG